MILRRRTAPRPRPIGPRSLGTALAAAASISFVPAAWATDEGAANAPSSPRSFSAYLDLGAMHADGTGRFANGAESRVFDTRGDALVLHQAGVHLGYQPAEGIGAVLDLVGGEDVRVFAPYPRNPGAGAGVDAPQAYLRYASGPLTLIAGRFVTLAGNETIDPRTDATVSRSILYGFAIPFAHTGVRTNWSAGGHGSLSLGIVNGWDDLRDTNAAKTLEVGATWLVDPRFTLAVAGYFGRERVGGLIDRGPEGARSLVDVIATWIATPSVTVVVNADLGRQANAREMGGAARWSGVAGTVQWAPSEHWHAALRAEAFSDPDGYRMGFVQAWHEVTLTGAWLPNPHLELRLEGRIDRSTQDAFVTTSAYLADQPDPLMLRDSLRSVALEVLVRY